MLNAIGNVQFTSGSNSDPALQSNVQRIIRQDRFGSNVVAGEEIRLGCVIGGRPPPEIRWWRQNGQLPASRTVVSDNSVLTVRNVIPDDEDVYVCQGENSVGSMQALSNVQIHCKYFFLKN